MLVELGIFDYDVLSDTKNPSKFGKNFCILLSVVI